MANLLVFVTDLLTSRSEQQAYLADRLGYLDAKGQPELTGEDVSAALDIVRDTVAVDVARAVARALDSAPPVMPEPGDTPRDAAVALLDHFIAAVEPVASGNDG